MMKIHTTPQILEVANFALLRALIISLENKRLMNTQDIKALRAMAIDMCNMAKNEDPASSQGAVQLLEHWFTATYD